jgi:hypothetical protein
VKYRYDSEAREEYRKAIHFYGKAAERFFDAVESAIERIRAYVSVAISGCPRKQHPALQTVLYPLRAWLESNIEVVAKDSNAWCWSDCPWNWIVLTCHHCVTS